MRALALKGTRPSGRVRCKSWATRQPFSAGIVNPVLEVLRDEPKWTFTPTNMDRGDATVSRCVIQPGSRDFQPCGHLSRLEKVWRADLSTAHMGY